MTCLALCCHLCHHRFIIVIQTSCIWFTFASDVGASRSRQRGKYRIRRCENRNTAESQLLPRFSRTACIVRQRLVRMIGAVTRYYNLEFKIELTFDDWPPEG